MPKQGPEGPCFESILVRTDAIDTGVGLCLEVLARMHWIEHLTARAFKGAADRASILEDLDCPLREATGVRVMLRGARIPVDDCATAGVLELILTLRRLPVLLRAQLLSESVILALEPEKLFSEFEEGILRAAKFLKCRSDLGACLHLDLVAKSDLGERPWQNLWRRI